MPKFRSAIFVGALAMALLGSGGLAISDADHDHDDDDAKGMTEELREQHSQHEHGHDFEAVEDMTAAQLHRMVDLMQDIGLAIPPMNAANGRRLFVETGCVVCHSVNGVGGDIGPSLNAADMPSPMNVFEFAARMWRGAAAMTIMQQDLLGDVIKLTGQDLADLVAFAHDEEEQQNLTREQIPEHFREMLVD